MTIRKLQDEILKIKEERGVCILAHSYQAKEITEVADFTGDSFALSTAAEKTAANTVVVCGVRFMAETVKILSPDKKVVLANPNAGCPMAENFDIEMLEEAKRQYPDYTVVAYINTTAKLKALCDVCVTSSSAVSIVRKIENPNILFIPDCNLGNYIAGMVPEKNIKILQGNCPIHAGVELQDAELARASHPDALLLVHPECLPGVSKMADFVGSTSAIMDYAVNSPEKEFLIGTEMSIVHHLQYRCPDKVFYPLSGKLVCPDMRMTSLPDLYLALTGAGEEIVMDPELINAAGKCIHRMINS
ncbi:MAG: quinolinate synthase NadA [Oscillospiraceae bacterium]|jgi:quinolinate synthase|nr:quinolinate synthase NadA [Oscillospiraceae bacterium]